MREWEPDLTSAGSDPFPAQQPWHLGWPRVKKASHSDALFPMQVVGAKSVFIQAPGYQLGQVRA